MRQRHLILLLALVGCAGARAGSSPDPETAALRESWLLYVEPVQTPLEPQFATSEFRRLLQSTGRFIVVDDSTVAHAVVRTSLTLPMESGGTVRGRESAAGRSPSALPSGTISLSWVNKPETPPWSRVFHGRLTPDAFTRSLEDPPSGRPVVLHRVLVGLTAILRREAGPMEQVPSVL